MGGDSGDARSVRRRGAPQEEDLPGLTPPSGEPEAEPASQEFAPDRLSPWEKSWAKPAIGVGAVLSVVLGYFFVLPIPLIYLEEKGSIPYGSPLYRCIDTLVAPLAWLMEHAAPYGEYIHWLAEQFA